MLYDIRFTHERQMTCPHLSSIGGFVGVLSSLDTGHEKTLWKRSSFGIGISTCSRVEQRECPQTESADNGTHTRHTGISSSLFQSAILLVITVISFRMAGSAEMPAERLMKTIKRVSLSTIEALADLT
jgi:hypothetical protein